MKQLRVHIARACLSLGLAMALCALPAQSNAAQDNIGPDIPIGMIPGTSMMRDEYRARAFSQLVAIALCAHAYWVVKGEYPPDFAHLRGSDAWVIEAKNLFTDRPVQGLFFEPKPVDLTNDPSLGIYEVLTSTPPVTPAGQAPGGQGSSMDDFIKQLPQTLGEALKQQPTTGVMRVKPEAIRDKTAGDVFYYTKNGLLQLVMFAPDGTFVEHVDAVPCQGWLDRIRLRKDDKYWPQGVYTAVTLYFSEFVLPQYYSLVQYMSDAESKSPGQYDDAGPAARIKLAAELGLELRNPLTRKPIDVAATAVPGAYRDPGAEAATPLKVWMADGKAVSLADLRTEQAEPKAAAKPADRTKKPAPKRPGAPPMGGRHD
jgi:hypothetical protein